MRGNDENSGSLFSYIDLEARVRSNHPLRPIWVIANAALAALSQDFVMLYSGLDRRSIAPEKLLRAMQAFYSVRSERQLMERIEFDLLFRWSGSGWMTRCGTIRASRRTATGCWRGEIAAKFLAAVLSQPRLKRLLSSEHFSVDGTLIQAWASMKSFKPKQPPGRDGGPRGGGQAARAAQGGLGLHLRGGGLQSGAGPKLLGAAP
jgi:transposase